MIAVKFGWYRVGYFKLFAPYMIVGSEGLFYVFICTKICIKGEDLI